MQLTRRHLRFPPLSGAIGNTSFLFRPFRIMVDVCEGMIFDSRIFPGCASPLGQSVQRNMLCLPLKGTLHLLHAGKQYSLRAGECWTHVRIPDLPTQYRFEDCISLVVEWEKGSLGTRSVQRGEQGLISPTARKRMRELVQMATDPASVVLKPGEVVRQVVEILRCEGLPLDPVDPDAFVEQAPPWADPLSRALDVAAQSLQRGPSITDVEGLLGWSPSTIWRRMKAFSRYYSLPFKNWREQLHQNRIITGVCLLSRGVSTAQVAQTLGYGSRNALRTAFKLARLPPPAEIPEALRRLG